MAETVSVPIDVSPILDRFVSAFNVYDLDQVMTFFADDAVYRPGDGSEHHGRDAIRRAFEPQFKRAFGFMRFDEHDRFVDSVARKAVSRWVCRHDLAGAKLLSLPLLLQRVAVRLLVGRQFGWQGVDIFHFDAAGMIVGKFTYANYGRPRLCAELGVDLAGTVPRGVS